IFFSALDWGLGHATRSVPLIKQLAKNNKVILGVTPVNYHFFRQHFPQLAFEQLPSYAITYSSFLPVWLTLAFQWPGIMKTIKLENRVLQRIIAQHGINMVVSDSRYGLNHPSVHSVFITHQLKLRLSVFSFFANAVNLKYLRRFDEIWVPDYQDKALRLSGELS